jgi:hypothetical protein
MDETCERKADRNEELGDVEISVNRRDLLT